jgi:enamine deaminase RidA (YjgF/YER057c/UK114 family)
MNNALFCLLAVLLAVLPSTLLAQHEGPTVCDVERRLEELGIILPEPAAPVANYVPAVRTGNLVFLAGTGPLRPDGTYMTGRLSDDMTIEQGQAAARLAGIALLSALRAEIGDLNLVRRIVKVYGMVNSTAEFTNHPQVINGFSDLMVDVFGPRGRHARGVAGFVSLPLDFAVEIEMVVEVDYERQDGDQCIPEIDPK